MSKSSHVLKVQKGDTVYTCDLYTTTAEAAVYGASAYFPVNVNGTTLYAPLYPTTFSQVFYDDFGTPVHIEKDGTEKILAIHSLIRLGITAVANETITVTAGGVSWTSGNKWFPYGTTWTAKVTGATGWNAGALTPGASGTLTNANVTVTAGAATHKTYILTLAATTNQTITLYYKNHNGSALATSWTKKTSTSSAQKFTLGHGSQWYATVAGATGWNAGTISGAGSSSSPNTLTAAKTVSATAATHKTFTLKSTSEANQTITVKYKNYNGTSFAAEATLAEGGSVTVGYGTTWTATLTASAGYTAGTLSPGTKGTVTANTTISATNATAIKRTVTFNIGGTYPKFTVTYKNKSGTTVTSGQNPTSIKILSHTTITITCTMAQGEFVEAKCLADTSIINYQIYGGNSKATAKITKNIEISIVGGYDDGT